MVITQEEETTLTTQAAVKHVLILFLLVSATFFVSNQVLDGSLHNSASLSAELNSPADSTYLWKISTQAPFKYRALHKVVVSSVFDLLDGGRHDNDLFFLVYKFSAFLFHLAAVLLFYYFLVQVDMKRYALLGSAIFSLLPAMSLAYNLPVHTREDTLAYCLLLLGLIAIIKNKPVQILLFSILGVTCRETLMLLPFVNLFFNTKQNIFFRLGLAGICFAVFLLIRYNLGFATYDYWEGFRWNLNHLSQVVGFGFITFGFLWIPFFYVSKKDFQRQDLLIKSSPSVFVLVLVTTFLGGIFNEIRILYLLSPWVVYNALVFIKNRHATIQTYISHRRFRVFALAMLIVFSVITWLLITRIHLLVPVSKYEISYESWAAVSMAQLYLLVLFLHYLISSEKGIK